MTVCCVVDSSRNGVYGYDVYGNAEQTRPRSPFQGGEPVSRQVDRVARDLREITSYGNVLQNIKIMRVLVRVLKLLVSRREEGGGNGKEVRKVHICAGTATGVEIS